MSKNTITFRIPSFYLALQEKYGVEGALEIRSTLESSMVISARDNTEPYPRDSDSSVLLSDDDVSLLIGKFSLLRLQYWVKYLNDYAAMSPAKFKKYKNHKAVIMVFDRRANEEGKEWCPDHPNGPGFYPAWVVKDLRRQLTTPTCDRPAQFPK